MELAAHPLQFAVVPTPRIRGGGDAGAGRGHGDVVRRGGARRACGDNGWPTRGKASVEWPAAATAALSQIDPPSRLAGYEEKKGKISS
jgi:hypothetical protein